MQNQRNETTMQITCVFYVETNQFPRTPSNILFQKMGIDKNIYKPFNKSEGLQPIYFAISTILFSFTSSVM